MPSPRLTQGDLRKPSLLVPRSLHGEGFHGGPPTSGMVWGSEMRVWGTPSRHGKEDSRPGPQGGRGAWPAPLPPSVSSLPGEWGQASHSDKVREGGPQDGTGGEAGHAPLSPPVFPSVRKERAPPPGPGRRRWFLAPECGMAGQPRPGCGWVLAPPPAGACDLECVSSPRHASVSSFVTWARHQASLGGGWGHFKAEAPSEF